MDLSRRRRDRSSAALVATSLIHGQGHSAGLRNTARNTGHGPHSNAAARTRMGSERRLAMVVFLNPFFGDNSGKSANCRFNPNTWRSTAADPWILGEALDWCAWCCLFRHATNVVSRSINPASECPMDNAARKKLGRRLRGCGVATSGKCLRDRSSERRGAPVFELASGAFRQCAWSLGNVIGGAGRSPQLIPEGVLGCNGQPR